MGRQKVARDEGDAYGRASLQCMFAPRWTELWVVGERAHSRLEQESPRGDNAGEAARGLGLALHLDLYPMLL